MQRHPDSSGLESGGASSRLVNNTIKERARKSAVNHSDKAGRRRCEKEKSSFEPPENRAEKGGIASAKLRPATSGATAWTSQCKLGSPGRSSIVRALVYRSLAPARWCGCFPALFLNNDIIALFVPHLFSVTRQRVPAIIYLISISIYPLQFFSFNRS